MKIFVIPLGNSNALAIKDFWRQRALIYLSLFKKMDFKASNLYG